MKKVIFIGILILLTCSISFPLEVSRFWVNDIFGQMSFYKYFSAPEDEGTEKSFKVGMGKSLEMDLSSGGTIKISGWDKEELYARVNADDKEIKQYDLNFEETPSGIKITSGFPGGRGRKHSSSKGLTFEIKVPDRFNLNLHTMGGGIEISNVEGEMEGETKGGSLRLDKLKGNLNLRTMGGSIELTGSDVDGSVSTMGGNVNVSDVKGDVKGSSMGGNVSYKNITRRSGDNTGKEVHISSMGGSIDVDTAPNGASVNTMGGNITIKSAGKYVKASTMGGNVDVDEVDGSVSATTMGGDVSVKILGNASSIDHDVTLTSMSGEITLNVPADFSMIVDIDVAYTENEEKPEIKSDFDLNIKESDKDRLDKDNGTPRKHIIATGNINGGKNHVKIKTVNGNIYLKKSS